MEIVNVNNSGEITIVIYARELTEWINWKIAQQYDIGFNEGWGMAEEEHANAKS